jgi:uncharacterized membrane protein
LIRSAPVTKAGEPPRRLDRNGLARADTRLEANVTIFPVVLVLATLLCALVAGFLFAFAVVIMPGLRRLDDRSFIRAFQVIDGVIQNSQPLFVIVWAGSVVAVIAAAGLGIWTLSGTDRLLILSAAALYLLCVQLPTVAINVPLNNALQTIDPGSTPAPAWARAREAFEPRWNRWNAVRTVCASLASLVLMLILLRV